MRALLAIVRKDLLLFRTDRRAVLMQIAAPVLISAFFGFVFTRSTSDAPSAKIVVLAVDQDASATSKGIIAGLSAESLLDVRPATDDAAPDQVRRADASVAVVFPPNFGADAGSSLFRAEGSEQIDAFLQRLGTAAAVLRPESPGHLLPVAENASGGESGARSAASRDAMGDGFFYALVEKT